MIEWNKFDYKLVLLIYIFEPNEIKSSARKFVDRSHSDSNRLHESTNTIYTFYHRLMCDANTTQNVTSSAYFMLEQKIWRKHFAHISPPYFIYTEILSVANLLNNKFILKINHKTIDWCGWTFVIILVLDDFGLPLMPVHQNFNGAYVCVSTTTAISYWHELEVQCICFEFAAAVLKFCWIDDTNGDACGTNKEWNKYLIS